MDARARLSVIAASSLFGRLPTDARALLSQMMKVERFQAGPTVCELGEAAHEVYLVAEGALEVRAGPTVRKMGRGDVLGEYAMFSDGTRTADVTAIADSVLLSVELDRFSRLLKESPEALWVLLETAVNRLVALERAS